MTTLTYKEKMALKEVYSVIEKNRSKLSDIRKVSKRLMVSITTPKKKLKDSL